MKNYSSWSDELTIWENNEETGLKVFKDKDLIESISVRFNIGSDIRSILLKLIDLAVAQNFKIVDFSQKKILDPDIQIIKQSILNSDSYKFVLNPKEFLNVLSQKL